MQQQELLMHNHAAEALLHASMTELHGAQGDLTSRVRIAEDEQQHKRLNQVEGWLQRADHVVADADQLSRESPQQVEKLCMGGCCSRHPRSTHKFGKQIATILQEVKHLKENGDFSDVARKPPLPSATKRPSEPTVGLESYVNQVWSIASQDRPIEKVQDEIAKRIGLSNEGWESRSRDEKAGDIFNVLCRKKFALLLDDIWERFDLTGAGVPLPTQGNGSKVIFTTRSRDVCCQMQPNMANNIKVECLPPGKALKLFEEKDYLSLSLTIGRAMASKKTPPEWEYAIEVLRQSAASVFPGVGKEMYPKLKFSYDSLTSERVKSCFLYCSLYPEDHPIQIDELIHCWIGEGFMDEHTDLSTARNQGRFFIGSLIEACLLEKVRFSDRVRMHDVVRDMALWIVGEFEKDKFLVKSGVQLKELPEAEKWEEIRRMSLMDNQIENLTEILECPNLQTLFLSSNDLKGSRLVRQYEFEELPVGIAKLVSLEHLNLSFTKIRKLPVELRALEKLKYLNLEWTRDLEMIPQQLISSFSKLQVLKMMRCGYGCSLLLEDLEHLKYLNVLTLTFRSASELEKASRFNKFFSCAIEHVSLLDFRDSRSLNILALANLQNLCSIKCTNCMDLKEVKIESNIVEGARYFHSLRYVGLTYCKQMMDVSWVIFAPHLEKLLIRGCNSLEEIISEEKVDEVTDSKANTNLFSRLEQLDLCRLPKMKTIYCHALPFPRLKKISIVKCPMLKKLPLNSNSAKGQRLIIKGEKGWWKDVEWEDESTRTAFLPSFRPQ
ncbi:disease resistance protein SUMM2 [Gossypium hirsutum]|uniref:Disease resistance protein SUMM2 n=1 Tax=Gossypium hirsutum TaxID=3635 RepID=A0ABM2ZN47_GOSHI|nr:disease resistance protein SUMM2-like [Gossypium hirsutum]